MGIEALPSRRLRIARAIRPLRIARILDQDAAFLQFIEKHGLTPGQALVITTRNTTAGAMTVRVEDRAGVSLGLSDAAKIRVHLDERPLTPGSARSPTPAA